MSYEQALTGPNLKTTDLIALDNSLLRNSDHPVGSSETEHRLWNWEKVALFGCHDPRRQAARSLSPSSTHPRVWYTITQTFSLWKSSHLIEHTRPVPFRLPWGLKASSFIIEVWFPTPCLAAYNLLQLQLQEVPWPPLHKCSHSSEHEPPLFPT